MSTTGSDKKDLKRKDAAGKKKQMKAKAEAKPEAKTKTRAKGSHNSFKVSIRRLMESLHPDSGVSKNGMSVLNSFALDIYDQLATEGSTLMRYQKTQTLSGDHILAAIKLVLPPSIAEAAISEAKKAKEAYEKHLPKH